MTILGEPPFDLADALQQRYHLLAPSDFSLKFSDALVLPRAPILSYQSKSA